MDQNPFKKIGRHCVQGMIPFLDVTKDIGGLKLVPKSHSDEIQEQIRKERSIMQRILSSGDFVKVEDAKYENTNCPPLGVILLHGEPRDMSLAHVRSLRGFCCWPDESSVTPRRNSYLEKIEENFHFISQTLKLL